MLGAWAMKEEQQSLSHGDRGLDGRVGLVALEGEVLELEVEQLAARGVEAHAGKRMGSAPELLARLLEVVEIEVRVAQRKNEFAGLQVRDLRDHQREERVGGDV